MEAILTGGAIEKMLKGEVGSHTDMVPTLQVTELKPVKSTLGPNLDRFRLTLSDGIHLQQGMLGTLLNNLVHDGNLLVGSIFRLTSFTCNLIRDRMIVIIQDLEVIRTSSDIIGRPVPMGKSSEQRGVVDSGVSSCTSGGVELSSVRQINETGQQGEVFGTSDPVSTAASATGVPRSVAASARAYGNPSVGNGFSRQDYGRGPPGQLRQPPPMYGSSGPVGRNEAPFRIIPINALSPYMGRWTIKARVTSKSELKRYSNHGDGKVFNFDLLDSDGGEIRVTCFNSVADQFFDMIVTGNLYMVSRGTLKPAHKTFNPLDNDYEITLDNASTIQQCYEEDPAIPRQQFHFRSIGDIEGMNTNSIIDVIGIVSSISPTGTIMRKDGVEVAKRTLQLKDMSGRSVEVTMWGNFCNAEGQKLQSLCDSGRFPVLALKAGRIGEINGKTLSTIRASQLFVDPDFAEAQKLKEWFEREGRNAPCIPIHQIPRLF